MKKQNVNKSMVNSFSDESEIFDQSDLTANEHSELFVGIFHLNATVEYKMNSNNIDFGYLSYRM
jgi:hypothetical protein